MHYDLVSPCLDFARLCFIISFTFLVNCEFTEDRDCVSYLASCPTLKSEVYTHTHTHSEHTNVEKVINSLHVKVGRAQQIKGKDSL